MCVCVVDFLHPKDLLGIFCHSMNISNSDDATEGFIMLDSTKGNKNRVARATWQ